MCCGAAVDIERGGERSLTFDDDYNRRSFITKVYFILGVQLLITVGLVLLAVNSDDFYDYAEENPMLLIIALVVVVVSMIVLLCCQELRRKAPYNYIFLGLFTLAEAFLCSLIASRYDPHIVLMALGLTTVVCVTLSIYAVQTAVDFTVMGGILLVCIILFMLFGIVMMFFRTFWLTMLYCSLGVLLFSVFLIVDTQMMVGGDHALQFSPTEYVYAALTLYVDIIGIFIFLLQLLGDNA